VPAACRRNCGAVRCVALRRVTEALRDDRNQGPDLLRILRFILILS